MQAGTVRGMQVLTWSLVLGVASFASSNTLGEPQPFSCPIDATVFEVQLAKTQLTPALDRHVMRGRMGPVHSCPTCGWTGNDDDIRSPRPMSPEQVAKVVVHLKQLGAVQKAWEPYARSAEIASLTGRPPAEVGHRWLMAAQAAGPQSTWWRTFRSNARDAFERVKADPLAAYVAGELSRQNGDVKRAARAFQRVRQSKRTSPRIRAWLPAP